MTKSDQHMMHCEENNIHCKNSLSKDIHAQLICTQSLRGKYIIAETISQGLLYNKEHFRMKPLGFLCHRLLHLYEKNFKRYKLHYDLPHIRLCQPLENHVGHRLG